MGGDAYRRARPLRLARTGDGPPARTPAGPRHAPDAGRTGFGTSGTPRRESWWKESGSTTRAESPRGFQRGTQELDYRSADDLRMDDEPTEDDVTGTTHAENMDDIIDAVYASGTLRRRPRRGTLPRSPHGRRVARRDVPRPALSLPPRSRPPPAGRTVRRPVGPGPRRADGVGRGVRRLSRSYQS